MGTTRARGEAKEDQRKRPRCCSRAQSVVMSCGCSWGATDHPGQRPHHVISGRPPAHAGTPTCSSALAVITASHEVIAVPHEVISAPRRSRCVPRDFWSGPLGARSGPRAVLRRPLRAPIAPVGGVRGAVGVERSNQVFLRQALLLPRRHAERARGSLRSRSASIPSSIVDGGTPSGAQRTPRGSVMTRWGPGMTC
jgi:hypothetical protein